MALSKKAQAAWDAIKASGQVRVKREGAGGARLENGLRIHAHNMSTLRDAGLLVSHTFGTEGLRFDIWADGRTATLLQRSQLEGWHFEVASLERPAHEVITDAANDRALASL